ncbi:conserved hypothetical protein [Rippkaea orientalis PCC 8801]|uniref:Uncharacterized protein n=1 Tax=Rippkaea orientalis (strain PCC 8801 / RF-1) TaxID=41431 RepID=B7K1M3_RIPO1|nr:hypothetical protein [Rippkaea orientalis]ACK67565.1 conserved hypothetical protein [Rippkaea orientalis PCC 8801]
MSQQNPQDWEQRLRDLEAEINEEVEPVPVRPFDPNQDSKSPFVRAMSWYQGLATPAKVGVAGIGIIAALSVLNTVLRLVTSLIMLGIVTAIFVALYKAFLSNKSS